MRPSLALVFLLTASLATAQQTVIRGTVTYVAAGTVYTSLGRSAGLADSATVYVTNQTDTIAVLKVFAVSSNSSACRIVQNSSSIMNGQAVSARVVREDRAAELDTIQRATERTPPDSVLQRFRAHVAERPWAQVRGRIGIQYYTSRFDNSAYNSTRPGTVFQFQANARDLPLRLDVYTHVRTLSRGGSGLVRQHSINQSRIQRASIEYNDGTNTFAVGRIIPSFGPSVGYVDGLTASRRLGKITVGVNTGFQPGPELRAVDTDRTKVGGFVSVQPFDSVNLTITPSYSRTYFRSTLDRELLGVQVVSFGTGQFSAYAYSEFDLRKKSGAEYELSPQLANLFANVNYQPTRYFAIGVGTDASRALYAFSFVRDTPDSLLESSVRTGLSMRTTVTPGYGVSVSNSYMPRSSSSGFGHAYADNVSLSVGNILGTGVSVRTNMTFSATELTTSRGYSFFVQRNFLQMLDLSLRYQRYDVEFRLAASNRNQIVGLDFSAFVTSRIALLLTVDRTDGYGLVSNTVFSELSYRF
jgi:hypothetical protein